jgi:hypothetical protein
MLELVWVLAFPEVELIMTSWQIWQLVLLARKVITIFLQKNNILHPFTFSYILFSAMDHEV